MTDSLADLLKRQQQSSMPKASETPPHDEAAEVAAIAKEQAAKAAVIAGRFLGKASKQGAQKSVELSQQARQRLAEVTPEQWVKIRQNAKQAGLVVLALTGLVIIIWGGTKAWHAWHPATAVSPPSPQATPAVSRSLPTPPNVEAPAIAVEPSVRAVPPPRAVSQSPRQSQGVNSGRQSTQGVNARYRHTAPVLIQQKYQPDPLLAPKHRENWFTQMAGQPNPVAKQRPQTPVSTDPQEQKNLKALDTFFDKLNHPKKDNANGSNPAHQ